jgi:hypothetical protein
VLLSEGAFRETRTGGTIMNIRSTLAAILALAAMGLIADSAMALPLESKDAVEGKCNDKGGTFFPPSAQGVYGCVYNDGTGIVCGGAGSYRNTCSSFRRRPGQHGLPTRQEATTEKTNKKVEVR